MKMAWGAEIGYNKPMNTTARLYWDLSGAYYDGIMQACPSWVWTDQEFDDYFNMMTGGFL